MNACTINPKGSPQYWIVNGLNAVSAIVIVLAFIEVLMDNHHPLFDVGAPLGLAILFFLLPIGWSTVWWLNRRARTDAELIRGSCYSWTNLIQGWAWLMSCFVVGTYIYIYAAFMPRPFFPSQQGPDTEEALAGFEKYFGTSTAGSVHRLYYRHSPDMTLFRFDISNDRTLPALVEKLNLKTRTISCPMNLADPPEWWVEDDPNQGARCFQPGPPGSSSITLRLYPDKGRVYFLDLRR